MITEIKKGDRFRCVYEYLTDKYPIQKGRISKVCEASVEKGILLDISLEYIPIKHFNQHFTLITKLDPDTQQDLTREAIEQDEVESVTDEKIRRFKSGALRSDDTGRPLPSLFSPYALEAIGDLLSNNENSFGAANFWKGIPEHECVSSLMRHYCTYGKAVFTNDEELQYKEAVAMLFNAQALVHTMSIKREGVYKEIFDKVELIKK